MNTLNRLLMILLGVFPLISSFSCNNSRNGSVNRLNDSVSQVNAIPDNTTHELNNTVKWKADSATNKNVNSLKQIIALGEPENVNGYQQKGKQLHEGIDKMINECRMEGPAHEALHQWLEPLIEDVVRLKKTKSVEEGLATYKAIKSRLDIYSKTFE